SQFKTSIFHKTIDRMVESKPIYQNQIKHTLSV
ncbi:MAG TPA: IS1595 family transposase, partial [Lutibacter sp.]|nr:IS1595 family transposase [Lutibacter sp.]